ncbi:thiol reductant ABC exporter subunit CydD [Pseudoxanthomonas kalamensis DSM 18571]|uniref:thiol reductant ABC exporter subunit CydD n=1 Tax=Pseudoxanthomonas kalamensis TaxID=289483 RepID=UPI001391298A|nr:thiol reductant ABC exporter subunit CydD [Pseudoxanthomonas kalamensis]KAF1710454.1 thiol reductant ABC exporter subunit CydD [Pseudoxanthomonas kalamensis DSM 18571]
MNPQAVEDPARARKRRAAWLQAQLAPFAGRFRRSLACTVLSGWLLIAQAGLIAHIAASVFIDHASPRGLWPAFAALAAVLLLRTALGHAAQRLAATVAEALKSGLRTRLAAAVLARGPLWLRGQRSGALAELSVAHVDATEGHYTGFLPARTEAVWVPLPILLAVFAVDWVAGLVLLLTAPLVPVFMMLVGWGAEAAGRRQLLALARAGAHFADRLRGLDLIRVYGRGESELAGVVAAADDVRDRSMQVLRIAFLSSAVLEFFASVSVALIAVYFGFSFLGMIAPIGPGAHSLFAGLFCLLLAPEFYAPLRRMAAHYHDRANALAAAGEIEQALGTLPEPAPLPQPTPTARAATAVQVEALTLRHAGARQSVLEALSFAVPAGGRLALAGASGGGKSTLLEAIAGWLPPEQGRIDVAPGARIALAGQRPWLFQGSIADNIRLGAPQASDAAVRAAAEAAQVWRFASHLPDGLDTLIGERGFGLSGGEARRVGLARALLRDADLLLLDEPTAFLDPQTEADLLQALHRHAEGRTVIVATHSPAVQAWAGSVLWLPQGHGEGGAA